MNTSAPVPIQRPVGWSTVLGWLVEPAAAVERSERRNARLTSSLLLVIMIAMMVSFFFVSDVRIVGSFSAIAAAYALSRTRYYREGATASLLLMSVFLVPIHDPRPMTEDRLSILMAWMVLPVLVGSLVLPLRYVAVLIGGHILLILLYPVLVPNAGGLGRVLARTMFPTTFFPLILLGMRHRALLERDRQAELRDALRKVLESEALLEQRVEDRTQELHLAKDEAERANRLKSQFLASMSHELRTPLNAILNFTEMMSIGLMGPLNDMQRDALKKTLASGRHLLALINDVLDITKMHSGMMKLFFEDDVDLHAEIKEVLDTAEPLFADKPVQFVKEIDAELPRITADRRRVRQVLLNLISNAAKFTEQGSVRLLARRQGAEVLFAVIDSGPGIAKEEQGIIFEPFHQTETGVRHAGGTGLGLPISLFLVNAHGGRLWLESEPGRGAAFYFTVPPKPAAAS